MKKIALALFLFSISIYSQESTNKNAYVLFDDIVGQKNLEINSGLKYIEKYRTLKDEHQFLNSNFSAGTIRYNKQLYYNVPIIYDLYSDELIVKINSLNESYSLILDRNKTAYFSLANNKYINFKDLGFYQKLHRLNNQFLFKKNKKTLKSKIVGRTRYSKFIYESTYFLSKDDALFSVDKKREWIKLYPEQKSKINSFYKSKASLLKSSPDSFMIALFKTLNL